MFDIQDHETGTGVNRTEVNLRDERLDITIAQKLPAFHYLLKRYLSL